MQKSRKKPQFNTKKKNITSGNYHQRMHDTMINKPIQESLKFTKKILKKSKEKVERLKFLQEQKQGQPSPT